MLLDRNIQKKHGRCIEVFCYLCPRDHVRKFAYVMIVLFSYNQTHNTTQQTHFVYSIRLQLGRFIIRVLWFFILCVIVGCVLRLQVAKCRISYTFFLSQPFA